MKINITTEIRKDDFENKIHVAIIDELLWLEKQGKIKNAHELSRKIHNLIGNYFYK